MLAIIVNFVWLFFPFIFIVYLGNFITELALVWDKMQSNLEEVEEPFEKEKEVPFEKEKEGPFEKEKEETEQAVRKTTKKRKKLKSHKTKADISKYSKENFFNFAHDNNPPRYYPFHTNVNLSKGVTKIFNVTPSTSKFFVVNEDVFLDWDAAIIEKEYCGYHLYKVMRSSEPEIPEMDAQDEDLTKEDLTEDLFVTEEATKHGVIINSNVYLTNEQWHTIRELDKDIFSCTVCQFQCDAATVTAHLRSVSHLRELDGHRPLRRFDLSITRKITDSLHCAVCNSVYPIKNYREHENSKSHEEKLLTAINKVTDLLQDPKNNQKTTQYFNSNNIQAPNNAPNQWLNFDLCYDTNSPDNEPCSPRNETYSPRNEANSPRSEIHSPRNEACSPRNEVYSPRNEATSPRNEAYSPRIVANSPRNQRFIPSYEDTTSSDSYPDSKVKTKEIESKNFYLRNCFEDIKVYEEEEDMEEYTPPIQGISYASMASKPRVDVPKFLKIDLGAKEVRVKYESWHMIAQTDSNQVYCMVCKSYLTLRHKNQHCVTIEHKALLAKCDVVGAFEDYLIRDVNEKLYHCGHCNNLQFKNDIQAHIQKYHPMKNGNLKDVNPLQIFPERKPTQPPNTKITIDQARKNLNIYGDCKFSPFGSEMVVSNLSCHTLIRMNDIYYCALCDIVIQGDLIEHVSKPSHMQYIMMTPFIRPFQSNLTRAGDLIEHVSKPSRKSYIMTPFIRPFQSNLTRAIRGSFHCLLCNVLVAVGDIYSHNMSTTHTAKLADALGMRRSERPKQEVKYHFEGPDVRQNGLEHFLSTLPPEIRDELVKVTIKTHEGEIVQICDIDPNFSPNHLGAGNGPNRSELPSYTGDAKPNHPISSVNNNTGTGLYPSQMVTVSMLESGLLGVRTGSPVAAFRTSFQQQMTESKDLKANQTVGRIPVSSIKRKEDMQTEDLLSLQKQPVRSKETQKKPMETVAEVTEEILINIEDGTKVEREGEKTEKKQKIKRVSEDRDQLSSVSDDEELPFKLDEQILLKVKTAYFRVTNTAYHTLVHLSNGNRYCFVCSENLDYSCLQKHVNGREHLKNLAENKFLCNLYGQLLRQMYLCYHCTVCNVTMTRREVKAHLLWPTHVAKHDEACRKINKKVLKEALRLGMKTLQTETQKEHVYVNVPEPSVEIVTYVQSAKEDFVDKLEERKLVKKNQIILLKGTMLKINFESWHGIATSKSGIKCILCQTELTADELSQHVDAKYHNVALGIPFQKQYYPALMRKINENTINCVICNLELSADESLVAEHISGRKHDKNYSAILERTSQADCYSDCYKFPLTL